MYMSFPHNVRSGKCRKIRFGRSERKTATTLRAVIVGWREGNDLGGIKWPFVHYDAGCLCVG